MTLKVVSTFSGTGGSSCGYKLAGCEVLASVEFIPEAAESYRANFPNAHVLQKDIREVTAEEIFKVTGLKRGELDIFDGSPPCASFSASGAGKKLHGKVKAYSGTKQRVDDLFFEYTRLVDGLQPKFFVAENVKGMMFSDYHDIVSRVMNEFDNAGYICQVRVLNAADYGAPQQRKRTFFIGIRKDIAEKLFNPFQVAMGIVPDGLLHPVATHAPKEDIDKLIAFNAGRPVAEHKPIPKKWVSVKEAIQDIENDPVELDFLKIAMEKYANLKLLCEIKNPGETHHKRFNLMRNWVDKPSATILQSNAHAGAACVCHYDGTRPHTIPELKRLMSFPDDFKLTGTYAQQCERLGRAVAPLNMKAIAEHIIKLSEEIDA